MSATVPTQCAFGTERGIADTAHKQLLHRMLRVRMLLQVARVAEAFIAHFTHISHLFVDQRMRLEAGASPETLFTNLTNELGWTLDDLVFRGIWNKLVIIIERNGFIFRIRRIGLEQLFFQLVDSHVGCEFSGRRESFLAYVTDVVPGFPVRPETVANERRVLRESRITLITLVELVVRGEGAVVLVQQLLGLEGEFAGAAGFFRLAGGLFYRYLFVRDVIGEFELGMDAIEVALHVADVDKSPTALWAVVEVRGRKYNVRAVNVF